MKTYGCAGPATFLGINSMVCRLYCIAQLSEDTELLHVANQEASRLMTEDPFLQNPEHRALRAQVQRLFARQETAYG